MGASASVAIQEQEARRRSRSIDETLAADREKLTKTVKILLLGPCDAGKSTLAKQVRLIHDKGFSDKEKAQYRHVVRANLASSLLHVLEAMKEAGQHFPPDSRIADVASKMTSRLQAPDAHEKILDLKSEVHMLVSDEQFHRFLEASENIGLAETTQYFFKSIDRILSPSFAPTDYDILRARQKSLGLAETVFHFRGFQIRLCDVDGSSSVKKKWLQCFDDVAAVLFIVPMDAYDVPAKDVDDKTPNEAEASSDQTPANPDQTELEEAMESFNAVCRHKGFANTPIILFLNKRDVFRNKLKVSSLAKALPDYKGTCDHTEATRFLKQKFDSLAAEKKNYYSHVTCAIDTASVRSVFDSVLQVILHTNVEAVSKPV